MHDDVPVNMLTLLDCIQYANIPTSFEVVGFLGGRRVRKRLMELGIVKYTKGCVLQCCPVIICIGDTRIAVGCGLADKILIKRLEMQTV